MSAAAEGAPFMPVSARQNQDPHFNTASEMYVDCKGNLDMVETALYTSARGFFTQLAGT